MPTYAHFDDEAPLTNPLRISALLVLVDDEGLLIGRMTNPAAWKDLDLVASPNKAFDSGH